MLFIVDESAGIAVAEYLRQQGHDVAAVAEIMPQARDADILAAARTESRIVVTNDKDFGDLIFRSGQAAAGVLLLRLRDESSANRVRVVESVLQGYAAYLPDHFVVATEAQVRVRPLH